MLAALKRIVQSHPPSAEPSSLGSLEAIERETVAFDSSVPFIHGADEETLERKDDSDAISYDGVMNDPVMKSGLDLYRDSIVGSNFILQSSPNWKALGRTESWAEEFSEEVESKFLAWAESRERWVDTSGVNSFTGLIRLAAGMHLLTGEILATAEWGNKKNSPYKTSIQMISPERLSNPMDMSMGRRKVRGGIWLTPSNRAIGYYIRRSKNENYYIDRESYDHAWSLIRARKPWGRKQVLHHIEQWRPGQSRGLSPATSAQRIMWAARRLREILLTGEGGKAALIAYIKSSLPPEQVFEAIGAQSPEGAKKSVANFMQGWSESMSNLMKGSKRMTLNGGKMAVLPPGTEVDFLSPKSSGGESLPFLEFLERQAAQGFGISYEQLKRSFEESNYSSARASMIETRKHLDALKAAVIDPFAGDIYGLWLEEAAMKGDLETLKNFQIYDTGEDGKGYLGMRFSALSEAEWIGQGRGQVDELKETQAAGLRIKYGLSSPSLEWAKTNGKRFQAHVRQMQRDWKLLESIGINMNDEKGLEAEEKDGQHSKADGGENERSNRKKRK